MKIEEQATSLSLFGIFLSDRPIRMAAVLVSSFQLPQFNRKILFPPVAKEFGYVGVIGNPMGFARMLGSTSKISYQLLPRVFCRCTISIISKLAGRIIRQSCHNFEINFCFVKTLLDSLQEWHQGPQVFLVIQSMP